MYNERILPWFKENVADALFLKKQANVRWISGFKGADTCVMVTANGGFLITDPAIPSRPRSRLLTSPL